MVASQQCIELIKQFEGVRLMAYRDAVGVWTIGYGHTKGVYAGQCITKAQAESFLIMDLSPVEKAVNAYDSTYHWTQHEFDALCSFAFNLGTGSIKQVTANGTRTKAQISEKILAYNKAGGKVLAGLTRRRKAEKELFDKKSGAVSVVAPKKEEKEIPDMPTIKFGSQGKAVQIWQIILGITADGLFGGKTQEKTKSYQKKKGLTADGIVGQKTWTAALKEL